MRDLTTVVLPQLSAVFGIPHAELWFYLSTSDKLRCHASIGSPAALPPAPALNAAECVLWQTVCEEKQAILFSDWTQVDKTTRRRAAAIGATELYCIPLRTSDDFFGLINVWCVDDSISPPFRQLLETAGRFVGLTIEHLGRLRRNNMLELEVNAIQTVTQTLSQQASLETVFDAILRATLSLSDSGDALDAHIFLYDGEMLTFGAALWADGRRDTPFTSVRPHGLTATVARTGKTIAVSNMRIHPLFGEGYKFNTEGAIIGIPLKIGERVVGVMNVAYDAEHPFHTLEMEAHQVLAAQAAIAIENARLFNQVQLELTERRHAEEALKAEEMKYRALVENFADAIYLLVGSHYDFINPRLEEMFGVTLEEINAPDFDVCEQLIAENSRYKIRAEAEKRRQGIPLFPQLELTVRNVKTGREFEVELSNSEFIYKNKPTVHGIIRDITARKQLEEQLQYAQRMEAVGELAGGIAHNFNNILTAITALSSLAMSEAPAESKLRGDLHIIHNQSNRASALVKEMLYFSRRKSLNIHPLDVNQLIAGRIQFLKQFLGVEITLRTQLAADPAIVHGDMGAIEQILANITLNARDAMPDGGVMTISTKTVSFDVASAPHPEIIPGDYVKITVSDTGVGIEPENLSHIFEPFFTTKLPNQNSGLGLAMVFGLVKQLHGFVQASSRVNGGATITLYFPISQQSAIAGDMPHLPMPLPGGNEQILLLDKDVPTADVIRRILENVGYVAFTEITGEAGLALLRHASPPIDMVISCAKLPDMTAADLYEAIAAFNPPLKKMPQFIFTTSRPRDNASEALSETLVKNYPLLKKPYSPVTLTETIRKMLELP